MNYICAKLNEVWLGVGYRQRWWCILIMREGGGVISPVRWRHLKKSQSVHKVSHWGYNHQSNSHFTCCFVLFKHPKSSCLGSHTDLLAQLLHTAPHCPPGHSKYKCLESPEWKLGLFFKQASFKATTGALKAPGSYALWINEGSQQQGGQSLKPATHSQASE